MEKVEIIAWVLATFGFLKAVSGFFDFVSKQTKNKTDDKISLYLGKSLGAISKVIDLFTANSKPKA